MMFPPWRNVRDQASDFVMNCGVHAFEPLSPRKAHRGGTVRHCPIHQGTRPCWPYGWGGHLSMLSVKGFFSVASIASLFPFVPVCLSSVSDPCLYPSCLCLPLRTSFSRCPPNSRREGAAASSVLSLGAFIVLEVNNNYAAATIYRYLGPWQCKLTIYFQENFPKWNYAV